MFWLWILICPLVGAAIGQRVNNAGMGMVLGLLFGPLGWLLVLIDDKRPQCPECKGRLPDGARRCKHCGAQLHHCTGACKHKAADPAPQPASDPLAEYKDWKANQPSGGQVD